jgi:outer membrane biogenesis lipoprotein LolB
MKKNVFKTTVLMIVAISVVFMLTGCQAKPIAKTGFLSDYSRLRAGSWSDWGYVNTAELATYQGFIIEPVNVHFNSYATGTTDYNTGRLSQQDITELTTYMHERISEAVSKSKNSVVYRSGPRVARIRLAITDINRSTMSSHLPGARITGSGLGGATIEAEILDSTTGEQIAATIEAQKGFRLPLAGVRDWSSAKQAMDTWGNKFRKRLEDARQCN